jgi:hypothetical protein
MKDDHELVQLMQQAADTMAAEYRRIRARAREDPGTAGDEGEENWAELLRQWLPSGYHVVTKGRMLASDGRASRQLDVVVLSPSYPTGLLNKKIYLAAGVLAAFECKNTLRTPHIARAVRTGAALRELARNDRSVRRLPLFGLLAHSHVTGSAGSVESVSAALERADRKIVTDPRDCLDFLCVADLGTWAVMRLVMGALEDHPHGRLTVSYMGPMQRDDGVEPVRDDPGPLGRFLTGLLRRLGPTEPPLAAVGAYFETVGLFGVGQGSVRSWDLDAVPEGARETVF